MALGNDFSFMGNQHRLVVSEKEYFIDLLFLWCAAKIEDIRKLSVLKTK